MHSFQGPEWLFFLDIGRKRGLNSTKERWHIGIKLIFSLEGMRIKLSAGRNGLVDSIFKMCIS